MASIIYTEYNARIRSVSESKSKSYPLRRVIDQHLRNMKNIHFGIPKKRGVSLCTVYTYNFKSTPLIFSLIIFAINETICAPASTGGMPFL